MENFFTRYKNPLVLMAVLVVQVIALATQVKRPDNTRESGAGGGPRLIRVWTVTAITPFERALVATGHFFRNTWHNYIDLHNVRRQNRELQGELDRMRLEQARLKTEAEQSRRLEALLDFKQRYMGPTIAAQVIGNSGSDLSHLITIDKGSFAGIRQGMAVITPDGIVGKVRGVYPLSSQVLMINDRESGAGVILEGSRLQGVLRGKDLGDLRVNDILSDEKVEVGERVITSGGDGIYPKGLPVGTVSAVGPDPEASPFLAISLKSAADLSRLEDVLVVTEIEEAAPAADGSEAPHRAADILAQRLPSVPKKAEDNPVPGSAGASPATAVKKQTAPQKISPAGQDQPPDQASPDQPAVQKKPGGTGTVKTPGAETHAVPVKPNRPQPQAPDQAVEKPPR
ncbi:MAG TPA: rod shape-determining protein MreC [Candidatus Angelobacter sp.]